MRQFILLASILLTLSAGAQYDMPDFRSKRELFTRIMEKDIRSDISTFSLAGIDEGVGKNALRAVTASEKGNNYITFQGQGLKVTITTEPFDGTRHKLGYYDNKYLVKIDNKAFFGDYGKMPKTQIKSVTAIIDRDTIELPRLAFFDLYNPVLFVNEGGIEKTNNKVYLSGDGRKVYIYMLKPESGGSYEVTWVIQDRKYLKRVVDFNLLK